MVGVIFWTVFFALPFFLAAGSLAIWQAWVFVAVNWISILYVRIVVYRLYPDLQSERRAARDQTKSWDRWLVLVLVALLPLATVVVAGLDRRNQWTAFWSPVALWAGLILYVLGSIGVVWAMSVNAFFSSHYRIQAERNHRVAEVGPYRWVRHPGYLGMLVDSVGLPLLLGSWPAVGFGFLSAVLTVLRTALEDRNLQVDLPGYADYSQRVPYRLFPWIW